MNSRLLPVCHAGAFTALVADAHPFDLTVLPVAAVILGRFKPARVAR